MSEARPLALVTGASAGIGAALARRFAAGGFDLLLTARRHDALDRLANELRPTGTSVEIATADLADPTAPARLAAAAAALGRPLAALVNNAGFGARGPLDRLPMAEQIDMLQVNVVALTALTRLLLPDMLERRHGRILNVASTAAFPPGPGMAVYYASKAYVLSFSEALWQETRGRGVTVTCLCPGPTATEFADRAGVADSIAFRYGAADPVRVADAGYRALLAGRRLGFASLRDRLAAMAGRHAPRSLLLAILDRAQNR